MTIGSGSPDSGAGSTEPLPPIAESEFAEYAFGHRLVEAYEVPTDGVAHPVAMDDSRAKGLMWVPQCSDTIERDSRGLQPDIGSLDIAGSVSTFTCLSGVNFNDAVAPDDMPQGRAEGGVRLAMRPAGGVESRLVAAYEPVPFEDFPFEQGEPLFDDAVPQDGEVFGGGLVFGVTDTVTSADLDTDGSATIELPESRSTQLYVTTEGKGRFWLESADPAQGAITGTGSPSSPENTFSGTLGRGDWWTSWTDQRATWPITARTDSGGDPERIVLRVECYEEGSFELQVIGQFEEEEQP